MPAQARLVGVLSVSGTLDVEQCEELEPSELCTCAVDVTLDFHPSALHITTTAEESAVLMEAAFNSMRFAAALCHDPMVCSIVVPV